MQGLKSILAVLVLSTAACSGAAPEGQAPPDQPDVPAAGEASPPQPASSSSSAVPADAPLEPAPEDPAELALIREKWTGDLDGMLERRRIRVLVATNKTSYFVDKGAQKGVTYEAFKKLEDDLNQRHKTGNLRVIIAFVPMARDEMLKALADGRGDVAAANLTVTEDRSKIVDFTSPALSNVRELVVTGPGAPPLKTLDDLSGQDIYLRPSSSFVDSLKTLNTTLTAKGLKPAVLKAAPEVFEEEDILEMVNAGIVKITIADSHIADFWKQVLPSITVHDDLAVRTGGNIAWAIRKNSPKLRAELDAFLKANGLGTAFGNVVYKRYLQNTKYAKNPVADAERKRLETIRGFFVKYAKQYDMDWVLMAAQGFQESGLDHSVRSPVGAVGVMQVMPATGKEMRVGDITQLENNVNAGVKYMRFMIDQYFADEPMDRLNKGLFAFAAYNAGPGRMRQLRREAEQKGLNPNVWFNNVERVVSERIGRETVQYVSNIYKYYVAYTLTLQELDARQKARESPG
jgi:membrane-bound lytic murein transglycosylase MltF